jgi:hypothetical protein
MATCLFLSRRAFSSTFAAVVLVGMVVVPAAADGLRVAPFSADITPDVGEPLTGGFTKPVATVEHPLLAKGIVLLDGGERYVLCSLDVALVGNQTYALFRERLAAAANTIPDRVALHEVQQHTAPAIDLDVQRLLDAQPQPVLTITRKYVDRVLERTSAAVADAVKHLRPVSHLALGWANVERVASSRRIRMPDGRIVARMSSTRDPKLHALPEGVIDPKLRSVGFFDGDRPLVWLHFYATHPQSFYGDGRVTYDVPGIAREKLQSQSGVAQIYFSGCGGNVTMGKYNDGTRAARQELSDRLFDAMQRSVQAARREPVSPLAWKTVDLRLPSRSEKEFQEAEARRVLADSHAPAHARVKAAMIVSWIERTKVDLPVQIACLHLGSLRILSLPGDTFVEYQLWAQQAAPERFVAVAGFGDFGPCEQTVKQAIAEALGVR